ncbi:MAG: hypothetical protein QOH88_2642 [Verrucomicrobiota bacterium]|jgi:hypothetical protein
MNMLAFPVSFAATKASRFIAVSSRYTLLIVVALLLASCGKKGKLDGTYSSSVQSYTFKGDTASASVMGKKIGENWPYTVDGKKVTLKGPGGEVILTINDDGSLSDPAKDKLVKK